MRPRPGAHRETDGQIALPLRALRDQQARDVGTGDQQHEERRRLPQREHGAEPFVEHALRHRHDLDAAVLVRLWILRLQPLPDDRHLAAGVGETRPSRRRPMTVR